MKAIAKLLAVAAGHIVFMFVAYGTGFFGLNLPYDVDVFMWLFGSTGAAFGLYYSVVFNLGWVQTMTGRARKVAVCASAAIFLSLFSLYWGVFFSFNEFGT
jgi:hypothetical protein